MVKSAYLHINTDFLNDSKEQTALKIEEKPTGEKYVLSKLTTVSDEERILFLDNRYYNISCKSAVMPDINWDTLSIIREGKTGVRVKVLNEDNPLIVRYYEPHKYEQVSMSKFIFLI